MKKYNTYCAIQSGNKYMVATLYNIEDLTIFRPISDIRKFDTFDEANQVAQDVSNGQYGYDKGFFVNMR